LQTLTACLDQDDVKTAALCLKILFKRNQEIDEGTLVAALHAAGRSGSVDLMQLAWAGLQKVVKQPSPAAHLARLQALTGAFASSLGVSLQRIFKEMAHLEVRA
jgi:hypothetical protein